MIKICIKDLTECKSLDKQTLRYMQGGHFICGTPHSAPYPMDLEEILTKFKESMPNDPLDLGGPYWHGPAVIEDPEFGVMGAS